MPTGYTADIEKGIEFKQFALNCARAFGALIMMRDEPPDAPIPDSFEPSSHAQRALEEHQQNLTHLFNLTEEQCEAKAKEQHAERVSYHQKGIEKQKALRSKYEGMKANVDNWVPPSQEHEGLKRFMQEQITESINFDCGGMYHEDGLKTLKLQTGEEWRQSQIHEAERMVAYYTTEVREENERTSKRNLWIKQLKESL